MRICKLFQNPMPGTFRLAYRLKLKHKICFMATKNRNSEKGTDAENRTGQNVRKDANNKKLPDNPANNPEETVSTAGDTSNGKYSKTGRRDEDIDNDDTRGGR